jgi:hypothetical protein
MNEQLSKIDELLSLFESIEKLIRDPFMDEISSNGEITLLQRRTSSLIGELDDIITEFGDRYRIQSNRKKDIFRDAITIRSQWGSGVLKEVIGELYIIREKYKKSIPEIGDTDRKSAIPKTANSIFQNNAFQLRLGYCFVMMPFTEKWSNRVWDKLKNVIERKSLKCDRADSLYGHNVLEDIWKAINEAEVLVADVTNKNPNVFYEIGLAHSLGKRVILITQNIDDIPFDFRGYRHLVYEDNVDGFKILENELSKFIYL